jgi:hypothetical protein
MYIMKHCADVTVISPPQLVKEVIKKAEAL